MAFFDVFDPLNPKAAKFREPGILANWKPAMARERFVLILEADPDRVPVLVRLRRLLKCLLRAYGLRCLSVEPVNPKVDR